MNRTAGPWKVEVHDDYTNVEGKCFTVAADVSNDDAHLIAAAPDLYEMACIALDFIQSTSPETESLIRKLSQAIDRAGGCDG